MEGILNSSHEMEISKVETCEVFEAGGGVCEMPSHDGSSEMFNLEKNTDSVNSTNPQTQEAPIAEVSKPIPPPEEISQNLCVEQNVNVTPVEINRPVIEPVNIENPNTNPNPNPNPNPFGDFNNPVAQKPNATSNKRKSDNHVESNIEEKKNYNMRKNIRGVINENNFDTITIAAQREESERLARVQSLKKSVKHKFSHPTLESMLEDLPFDTELPNQKCFINTCEAQDPLAPKKLVNNVELKEVKILKVEDKKVDKKVWNQWFSEERSSVPVEESDEVVTIDSSSDDDCIILSDSDECEDDDPNEDHHNSGLHVRDVLNIPNEHGKVLVNVGHVESEPDIFVAPQIAKIIKPHQIGGVRFLFDNIIESTKRFNNSSGFGCILAHSMGLGKTLQVVCFCDIFLRHTDSKTILCVMPINTIQNWMKEFNMWIPEVSHNHEEVRPRQFSVFALDDQHKTLTSRANIILRWANEGGVLLIGYELFRVLGLKIIKKREGKKHENPEHKRLLDRIHMALVKPGPDLVICDEGHRIKNAHAGISVALKQIRSRRRIVLTGYPLQNNLLEYWCMVDFVRPNYLGSKTEFCNMFERPIQNGQCIDSTPEDIKLMRYRAHVLHSLLVGFVQRRSDSVLQTSLPQKLEYVILTKMTKYQRELYEAFMNEVVRKKKVPNPLKAFAVCCKIWNHPDVLYRFLKRKEADYDLDIEEPVPPEAATKCPPTDPAKLNKPKADASSLLSDEVMPKEFMPALDNSLINEPPFYPNPSDQKCFYPNPMLQQPKEGANNFWQDGVGSVNAQPLQPDYVGLMAKPPTDVSNEEKLKCSSQIVDLDTKEVQFLKSDISTELDVASIPNASSVKPKVETDPPAGSAIPKVVKPEVKTGNETISYDWALSLIKNYEPGLVRNSPKMEVFLCILEESIKLGDRVLLFSQSLLTLDLVELFLQNLTIPESQCNWKKNVSYFRLDGSTSSMEREKLVNEFNNNTDVKLFLISTRAGSLGINLTGANRVVVFDASWNPCHDTQAVHRIYRYGQRKSCFVYRIVMDNCLEKNIYDRQVKKQGMSDRVVDECNPDAHLSIRELTNLCYDKVEENQDVEFKEPVENYSDVVMRKIVTNYKSFLSKEPFYHESLLIDRKDKKLSQTEKKLAKRGYEIEKKASTKPTFMPNNIVNIIPANRDCMINHKISPQIIRKNPKEMFHQKPTMKFTRWIPAEVWQRQGMSSQEMMLPIDVAIPTNSTETSNIVVKAGEKVMVLKSPKGVYMQLESGKIIAIKTSAEAAQDREKMKTKKLNCPDVTTKKPFNMMNSMLFKNDPGRNRVERPSTDDSDKDDVIVISDSINDNVEPTFDLTGSNTNKSRTETNTNSNSNSKPIPISIPAPIPNQNKKDTVVPQIFPQNRTELPSTELRKDKQDTVTSVLPLKAPQEFEQQQKQYEPPPPPRNNYVEKHHNNFYGNIPNNSNYEAYPPHNLENHQHHLQAMPPTNRWENKSPEVFKPSLKISNIPAPYPSTAISDMNVFEKNEKAPQQAHQAHQPQQAHQAHQPQQAHQGHQSHQPQQAHQAHQPQQAHSAHQTHQPQQTHPGHQSQQAHPAHQPQQAHSAHQPQHAHSAHQPQQAHSAHQPQQAHSAHQPQQPVTDIMNVDQYSSSYPQQPCKEPEEHSFHHHSLNLNSNYYNSLPSTSSTEDNNGSLNSLYNSYNNKAEATNYSENLYDNSTDSSHANYHHHHHQQMSKYSYGYYQPQYLPNFSNKVYDNNAFSSVSTQYYLRRPSTYSTSSTNGVDLGFNFTEPQGWMKKHLPD